jgi:uncharacterized protein (TIGR00156 family)
MNQHETTHQIGAATAGNQTSAAALGKAVAGALLAAVLLAGCASQPTGSFDIADALAAPDDTQVVITGEVVQQIAGERFLLRDHSGSITVEIDDDLLGEVKLAPSAKLRIYGEVERHDSLVVVEAETVQVVQ